MRPTRPNCFVPAGTSASFSWETRQETAPNGVKEVGLFRGPVGQTSGRRESDGWRPDGCGPRQIVSSDTPADTCALVPVVSSLPVLGSPRIQLHWG